MPEKQLPASPDLNQYKKQAKELARACRAGHPDALGRMRKHHPETGILRLRSGQASGQGTEGQSLKLADAQLVLAREHGFASWPKFAAEIERRRAERAADEVRDPVDAFLRAALVPRGTTHVSGTLNEAEAIRARFPEVERANLFTANFDRNYSGRNRTATEALTAARLDHSCRRRRAHHALPRRVWSGQVSGR